MIWVDELTVACRFCGVCVGAVSVGCCVVVPVAEITSRFVSGSTCSDIPGPADNELSNVRWASELFGYQTVTATSTPTTKQQNKETQQKRSQQTS